MTTLSGDLRTSMTEVNGLLVVALPADLSDVLLQHVLTDVCQRVATRPLHGVILNLSSVRLLDLSEFEQLRQLVATNAVLGVRTVLMGIRPGIAAYLCQMPVSTDDLVFCVDMASALEMCDG